MRFFLRYILISLSVILLIIGSLSTLQKVYENRLAVVQNPLVAHFMPMYRSLRKLPDVFFVPKYIFQNSELESFELTISTDDIRRMNEALPNNPFGTDILTGAGKVWVSADFKTKDYSERVKVRYRGNQSGHWNSYQKSYLIKFPKDNLFRGMRELTFLIASERHYFSTSLNYYRARKLGLTVPDDGYVRLVFNGADHGVYITLEHWSQEWLEKAQIEPTSLLVGIGDDDSLGSITSGIYTEQAAPIWKSWNREVETGPFEQVQVLTEIIRHTDGDTFKKLIPHIIDVEQWLARDALSVLTGAYHMTNNQISFNNHVAYFDGIEGRFKPVPYNGSIFDESAGFPGEPSDLQKRLWSIPEFNEYKINLFHKYISEQKEDDLAYLDRWFNEMNPEIYRDSAKKDSNLNYMLEMNLLRDAAEHYYDDPFNKIDSTEEHEEVFVVEKDVLELPGTFSYLPKVILTPDEFIEENVNFISRDEELYLPKGNYFFNSDVIIPTDTKLTIAPGTRMYMGEDVSIVSYSPVHIVGSESQPIQFAQSTKGIPWGVLAVVNTEEQSSNITNVIFSGGQDEKVNGIYFSGMLSFYNANGVISHSDIEYAHADDGVNVKRGSVYLHHNTFKDNSSDSLDVDFAQEGTIVENNEFYDSKGDSIDLSWSDIPIRENVIIGCIDKGVSVGEHSSPVLTSNIIVNCAIGIAIKDLSDVSAVDNILIGNNIAISAYQKKPIFGGGNAIVSGGILWKNSKDTIVDEKSSITFEGDINNSLEGIEFEQENLKRIISELQ